MHCYAAQNKCWAALAILPNTQWAQAWLDLLPLMQTATVTVLFSVWMDSYCACMDAHVLYIWQCTATIDK